jgi:hypothetical protein
MNDNDGLPGLAFLSACWRWVEQFILILSIPMLIFGATVTVVDLLTDGATTLAAPWLVIAWAISQGLGIESNISGSIHKARAAFERGSWVVMGLYTLLALSLGSVIVLAGYVYSYHQTRGIPIAQSLSDLGIDPATWVMSRSVLAFVLIAVSVLTHHTGKKNAASEAQRLREEIALAPLRAQANAAKIIGVRSVMQAAVKGTPAPSSIPMFAQDITQADDAPNSTPYGPVPWGGDFRDAIPDSSGPSIHLVGVRQRASPEARPVGKSRRVRHGLMARVRSDN